MMKLMSLVVFLIHTVEVRYYIINSHRTKKLPEGIGIAKCTE